ncbi:hypothetical protein V495_00425 [Pseudogymnoascus sp. VKM F-4514 (FW-929)]|nr:hypothetical protein V495_00425 [Pseudogymnoascus sp. VKM F-4514 (FW-929)]KFY62857.1 hypothetical protein V497_02188 [Pseudogymnoascus sp. VKM F-4516 (FW-969)]
MGSFFKLRSQCFPPKPTFTEKDVPSQRGKVFIVTGGNSGIGFELCRMLYGTGATIYMAARSKERASEAIKSITDASPAPETPGTIKFLSLDLNDLSSVKSAAATFAQAEDKLDILWNNAGMGANRVQPGARTAQGFEAMVGIHCIATLLFTQLLLPQLRAAVSASENTPGSVRVVWTASLLVETMAPPKGIEFENLATGTSDRVRNYAVSKAGTWMLGRELARRWGKMGILSVVQNPGNLRAQSYDGTPAFTMLFIKPMLHEPRFGGYTELFAGLSPEVTLQQNGAYVIPWGRIQEDEECSRKDIVEAMTPKEEGGFGYDGRLWEWCEEQWTPFV